MQHRYAKFGTNGKVRGICLSRDNQAAVGILGDGSGPFCERAAEKIGGDKTQQGSRRGVEFDQERVQSLGGKRSLGSWEVGGICGANNVSISIGIHCNAVAGICKAAPNIGAEGQGNGSDRWGIGRVIQLGEKSILTTAECEDIGRSGREVARCGGTGNVQIAGGIERDGVGNIITHTTEISGVKISGAIARDFGGENVTAAVVRRLERIGRRQIGECGTDCDVDIARGIERDAAAGKLSADNAVCRNDSVARGAAEEREKLQGALSDRLRSIETGYEINPRRWHGVWLERISRMHREEVVIGNGLRPSQDVGVAGVISRKSHGVVGIEAGKIRRVQRNRAGGIKFRQEDVGTGSQWSGLSRIRRDREIAGGRGPGNVSVALVINGEPGTGICPCGFAESNRRCQAESVQIRGVDHLRSRRVEFADEDVG